MHEIEFLPAWYPAIQRRYRWVIAQAWLTLAILVALCGYAVVERRAVRSAGGTAGQLDAQIPLQRHKLAQLNERLKYEGELRRQDQIVAELGLAVEPTRLLKTLEDGMTPGMALTNLTMEMVGQAKPVVLTMSMSRQPTDPVGPVSQIDHRLKVLVDGVAPSDAEVAALVERLQKTRDFENVALAYLHEGRIRDGRKTREFEITFEMNLNPSAEAGP